MAPIVKSVERFDTYAHAADLNVGRIAMLQTKLEGPNWELERRLAGQEKLTRGFLMSNWDWTVRDTISEIERDVEQSKPALVEKKVTPGG